jgi:Tol biopolymer transport system component
MFRGVFKLARSTVLLALVSPALLQAKCAATIPDLTKIQALTRQSHSTVLLRCYGYTAKEEAPGFLIVRDGNAREFATDDRYKKTGAPHLSADGAKLAYLGDLNSSHELVVLDLASGKACVLQSREASFSILRWAPDNSEIAISPEGTDRLEFVRVADGEVARSVRLAGTGDFLVSPDLRHVIFLEPTGSFSSKKNPRRMKVSIADIPFEGRHYLTEGNDAAWSPRGDKIAFFNALHSNCSELSTSGGKTKHLFGVRSKIVSSLIYSSSYRGPLVWSPDGHFLVFHESAGVKGGENRAYLYDLQNKETTKLVSAGPVSIEDWK